ncbi:MAG TPA: hypothetical protein PKA27_03860 [Fimbriimonadaceae bacterium]|nr:hypothetical protein [Fimbriimonadaceae bacterium]
MAGSPPPFYGPQPKTNSSSKTLILVIIGVIVLTCIGGIVVAMFGASRLFNNFKPAITCGLAFSHVRLALKDYAAENNGMLPKAESWQDDVRPYLIKVQQKKQDEVKMFGKMDPNGPWGCTGDEGKKTGMAYNLEVAGKKLDSLGPDTILVFEVPEAKPNFAEKYTSRPKTGSPKVMGEERGWVKMPVADGKDGDFQIKMD